MARTKGKAWDLPMDERDAVFNQLHDEMQGFLREMYPADDDDQWRREYGLPEHSVDDRYLVSWMLFHLCEVLEAKGTSLPDLLDSAQPRLAVDLSRWLSESRRSSASLLERRLALGIDVA